MTKDLVAHLLIRKIHVRKWLIILSIKWSNFLLGAVLKINVLTVWWIYIFIILILRQLLSKLCYSLLLIFIHWVLLRWHLRYQLTDSLLINLLETWQSFSLELVDILNLCLLSINFLLIGIAFFCEFYILC